MPGKYEEEYGENLLDHLEELFHPLPGYEKTRLQFWRLVTKLFNRNFAKQIYDWCDERGLRLTGHYVLEETLESVSYTHLQILKDAVKATEEDWGTEYLDYILSVKTVSSIEEAIAHCLLYTSRCV